MRGCGGAGVRGCGGAGVRGCERECVFINRKTFILEEELKFNKIIFVAFKIYICVLAVHSFKLNYLK